MRVCGSNVSPIRRQRDSPPVPLEQPHAEIALERLDLLRQRRPGDVQPGRGPAEVQLLGDRHEVPQLPKLHALIVVGRSLSAGSKAVVENLRWFDEYRSTSTRESENHEYPESRRHHRSLPGHRCRTRHGVPQARVRRRRELAHDRASDDPLGPGGPRRHRPARRGHPGDRAGAGHVRPDRHAGQQRRRVHRQAVHRVHRRGLRPGRRREPARLLRDHPRAVSAMLEHEGGGTSSTSPPPWPSTPTARCRPRWRR